MPEVAFREEAGSGRINPSAVAMACVGALQGLALYVLHEAWPASGTGAYSLFVGAVWAIVASGLVLHMARSGESRGRLTLMAIVIAVAFGSIAAWIAWQLPPEDAIESGDGARLATWTFASTAALFVLGPFLQIYQASGRFAFPYFELYRFSWRNSFVVSLGGSIAAAFWIVLALWAALFNLIGIDFFQSLFEQSAFIYPVTGAVFAYGLVVAREFNALVVITQALFRALLPLVALISVAFLGSLPVTGLAPLFATSHAASLLSVWLLVDVLFFNAVYLDGSSMPPYGTLLRRVSELGVLAMPALGAIALYALSLRIRQYGLTPERCWAAVGASVLTLYGVGYAAAVLRRGTPWLPLVRTVNVAMSFLVVALALGLHTPLGDPLGWSLRSQLARLADGREHWEQFDFKYLRFGLGRAGSEALQQLRTEAPDAHAVARIDAVLGAKNRWEVVEPPGASAARLLAGIPPSGFRLAPATRAWPSGLLGEIRKTAPVEAWLYGCNGGCVVFSADLDVDDFAEEIVASPNFTRFLAFSKTHDAGRWRLLGTADVSSPTQEVRRAILSGEAQTAPSPLRDLLVDGSRISFKSK